MKDTPFSRFESMAQRLVEDSFRRLLGGKLQPLELATHLARALEDSAHHGQVANWFRIHLNPADFVTVVQQPGIEAELAAYVAKLAQNADIPLPGSPQIDFLPNDRVHRRQVFVEALETEQPDAQTTQIHRRATAGEGMLAALHQLDAFLIVEGRQHFALDKPIISLGRRMDNDIVLDTLLVSRRHAQIRWRFGRFVLFDLSQRGRTAVNEQPITEHVLQPGDVIRLSDVYLIYGEGYIPSPQETDGQTLVRLPEKPAEP